MKDRIKQIMALVFETEVDQIGEDASPDTIDHWDSIRAINLVTALEEEFNIHFSDEEIAELLNLELITILVQEKLDGA